MKSFGNYIVENRNGLSAEDVERIDRDEFQMKVAEYKEGIITREQFEEYFISKLTTINLDYNGYNIKELNKVYARIVKNLVMNAIDEEKSDYINMCLRTATVISMLQLFDDANHRTTVRMLDLMLYAKGYDLDILKVFEDRKNLGYPKFPIIYDPEEVVEIKDNWRAYITTELEKKKSA